MHHWDLSINTPSSRMIYYNISWDASPSIPITYKIRTNNPDEYFGRYFGTEADKYPMRNPWEEFACEGAAYVVYGPEFRKKAREIMAIGGFELAIKYLFIRYFTPFHGKEYDENNEILEQNQAGLNFNEVEKKLKETLKKKPDSVRQTTIQALMAIKESMTNELGGSSGCSGCNCSIIH